MALYKVNSGDLPLASDLNQLVDLFTGTHDIGKVTFAPIVNSPTVAPSGTGATGGSTGVGNYQYVVTYITGYRKSNGTYTYGGETLASPSLTVGTTTGQGTINLTSLPVSASSSVVGRRIYRTAVGGTTFSLLVEIQNNTQTTYTDTAADTALTTATTPPTVNSTGTAFSSLSITGSLLVGTDSPNGDNHAHTMYGETWVGDKTNGWVKLASYSGTSYVQAVKGDKTTTGDLWLTGVNGNNGGVLQIKFGNFQVDASGTLSISGFTNKTLSVIGGGTHVRDVTDQVFTEAVLGTRNSANGMFDGTNWTRWDTTKGAAILSLDADGSLYMRTAPSGTGNISWTRYNVYTDDYTKRTAVMAYRTTDFSLPAGVYTKINLTAKDIDTLGEMDVTTNYGRFTAANEGMYSIDTHMQMVSSAAGSQMFLVLYKNGSIYVRFHSETYAQTSRMVGGSVNLHLIAGDYVEICGYCTQTATISGGLQYTYLTVARL